MHNGDLVLVTKKVRARAEVNWHMSTIDQESGCDLEYLMYLQGKAVRFRVRDGTTEY